MSKGFKIVIIVVLFILANIIIGVYKSSTPRAYNPVGVEYFRFFILCGVFFIGRAIWKYNPTENDKASEGKEETDQVKGIKQEGQDTFDNNENELTDPVSNTIFSIKESNDSNAEEIEKDYSTKVIELHKNIKENYMKNSDKLVISILCLWSFIHTYLIIRSYQFEYLQYRGMKFTFDGTRMTPTLMFYPFTNNYTTYWFDGRYYDFTEYFVYVGGTWFMYFLFRYFKK